VVSQCLAASTACQVLLSDLATLVKHSLIPNLRRNQNHNRNFVNTSNGVVPPPWLQMASKSQTFQDDEPQEEDDNNHLVLPLGNHGGWASVCTIDWTKPLNEHVSSIIPELDWIIASDCVWLKSMLDALLDTVQGIFQRNGEARLLLSFQRRDGIDDGMFTRIETIVESVQSRGWTLECLAWRYSHIMDGDTQPKEVFLLEISP
jgi:hypothetical protein